MTEPKLVQVTFSLYKHIHDKLVAYCNKTGQNKTAILRQAVYDYLAECPEPTDWISTGWSTLTSGTTTTDYYGDGNVVEE